MHGQGFVFVSYLMHWPMKLFYFHQAMPVRELALALALILVLQA